MDSTDDTARKAVQLGDQKLTRGPGDELHQAAGGDTPVLTTNLGTPIADDQNSLRAGLRGPTLMKDFHFREKIFHFDHERIPERVVRARGMGVHGHFELYDSLSDITRADLSCRRPASSPMRAWSRSGLLPTPRRSSPPAASCGSGSGSRA